jgi:hypothetical protein
LELGRRFFCNQLQQHWSQLLYGVALLPGQALLCAVVGCLGGWAFWAIVVQQPTSLKLPQLKDAARQLGVTVSLPLSQIYIDQGL